MKKLSFDIVKDFNPSKIMGHPKLKVFDNTNDENEKSVINTYYENCNYFGYEVPAIVKQPDGKYICYSHYRDVEAARQNKEKMIVMIVTGVDESNDIEFLFHKASFTRHDYAKWYHILKVYRNYFLNTEAGNERAEQKDLADISKTAFKIAKLTGKSGSMTEKILAIGDNKHELLEQCASQKITVNEAYALATTGKKKVDKDKVEPIIRPSKLISLLIEQVNKTEFTVSINGNKAIPATVNKCGTKNNRENIGLTITTNENDEFKFTMSYPVKLLKAAK